MNGLVIFLAGIIIGTLVEPQAEPRNWGKTIIWVGLVVIGVLLGALNSFKGVL